MAKNKKTTNIKSGRLIEKGVKIVLICLGVALLIWFCLNYILKPNLPPGFLSEEAPQVDEEELEEEVAELVMPEETDEVATGTLPEVETQEITLIFGGDVMLSRYVGRKAEKEQDYVLPWANIKDEFKAADLAFINLEAPFAEEGSYFVADQVMVFKTDPKMIAGLKEAGIDIVSLANNHILNQGQAGLDYTKQLLDENTISYAPVVLRNVGFLAYTYDQGLDQDQLKEDLANLEAKIKIVSMHAGQEYITTHGKAQENFAHAAIDHGADLVIGHHPHVVQDSEIYKDKYIYYSLGNLIFDQDWSVPTTKGLVLLVTIENDEIISIEEKNILIENNFQPRFIEELE